MYPEELKYTAEHEWVRTPGEADGSVRIGITDFAQDALGDVVYVDLPEVGTEIEAESTVGEVESTKSVSDLFAPVTGTVTARNEELDADPAQAHVPERVLLPGGGDQVAVLGDFGEVVESVVAQALAQEVATRGITANLVAPGFISSPMTETLIVMTQKGFGVAGVVDDRALEHSLTYAVIDIADPRSTVASGLQRTPGKANQPAQPVRSSHQQL